jgi:hypothetical protein
MKKMGGIMQKGAPNMSGVASMSGPPNGSRGVREGGMVTSNRTLNMNVENQYDLNEMIRKVGLRFNRRRNEAT